MLHRWIDDYAKEAGGVVARTQRWVSFMVIATVLDRVRDENDDPVFVLKGGAAMELRLGLNARATKDYDVVFRDRTADMLTRLDEALQRMHADFAATRTEPVEIRGTKARRLDVRLAYRGRSWQTIRVEISPAEGKAGQEIDRVPAIPLDRLGLEGVERVPCVSVRSQLAQKLHACTGAPNDRSRDLIDLILLRTMLDAAALPSVREACLEIFGLRAMHSWPPTVTVFARWRDTFPREAQELGFAIRDVDEAAAVVRALVEELDCAGLT